MLNTIKFIIFALGIASIITGAFLLSFIAGFFVAGGLLIAVAFLLNAEINHLKGGEK